MFVQVNTHTHAQTHTLISKHMCACVKTQSSAPCTYRVSNSHTHTHTHTDSPHEPINNAIHDNKNCTHTGTSPKAFLDLQHVPSPYLHKHYHPPQYILLPFFLNTHTQTLRVSSAYTL